MSPRTRKLLKVTLTVLLLALVLPRVDFGALARAFGDLSLLEVTGLTVLVCLQQALLTKRFATILTAFGALGPDGRSLRVRDLIIDQQVGTAYNMVLPSSVGGDVIRGMRARDRISSALDGRAAVAWSAVLLDRLIGLLALVLVPLVGLLLGAGPISGVLFQAALAITIVLLPVVLFAGRFSFYLARLAEGRSERLRKLAAELGQVLQAGTWAMRTRALAWSFLYQLCVTSFFLIATTAFDVPIERAVPAVWVGLPLAFVLSILPITIGGLGLRESLFIGVLGLYGIAPAEALALSILWSAQGLATACAGIIALWCERAPRSPAPAA